MQEFETGQSEIDEAIERLICRSLDGEATAAEQAELECVLAENSAARSLYDEYRHNDVVASAALRAELDNAATATAAGRRRGLWLAAAGVVLGAAAVFALSFVSHVVKTADIVRNDSPKSPAVIQAPTYVDYNPAGDMRPMQRQQVLHRDLIGIPGPNKNTIYILERNVQSTRVAPVSGDF